MEGLLFLLRAEAEGFEYIQPGGIAFNLTVFLVATLLGGLLATILTVLHHATVGRFFSALIHRGATDSTRALRLSELSLPKIPGLRSALRAPSSLIRKLVSVRLPDGRVVPPLRSLDDEIAERNAAASAIHAEDGPILHAEEGEVRPAPRPSENAATAEATATAEAAATAEVAERGVTVDPDTAAFFLDDLHRRRAEIRFLGRGNELRLLIPVSIVFVALAATVPVYLPHLVRLLDTALAAILGG